MVTRSERPDDQPKRQNRRNGREDRQIDRADSLMRGKLHFAKRNCNSNSSRSTMTTAQNTIMKERIQFEQVAGEIVFQPLHPGTGASLQSERVVDEMAQLVCGHSGGFALTMSQRVVWEALEKQSAAC